MSGPPTRTSSEDIFSSVLEEMLHNYLISDLDAQSKEKLRDQIVARVMPYVKKIAHGLARRSSDPVEDLMQVGNIGLLKAIDKFNPLVGSSFKTYATYFITGEIRHYLRDKTAMIKAPRQMYELYYRINQIIQKLTEHLGRTPTDIEIAEELQCPVTKVTQAQDIERRRLPVSLDQFMVNDNGGSETVYLERLVDHTQTELTETHENRMLLEQAMFTLKEDLQDVVKMTYYEDLSQTEIAERLGISQMQVSRRLRKALELLSKNLKTDKPA
ncbi:sigma-70 family RNA polymerase sigma factor [Vampirovibrio sp.]|uniref:sigma-70 family RNA polymerase sigma factor n=1 Tax=Vampirovibrio sp. TaxID=2717857 RepID=UPI00359413D2